MTVLYPCCWDVFNSLSLAFHVGVFVVAVMTFFFSQEEFYGSNVILMKEKTSTAKGHKRAGWFNVVRGAVRQVLYKRPNEKSAYGMPVSYY